MLAVIQLGKKQKQYYVDTFCTSLQIKNEKSYMTGNQMNENRSFLNNNHQLKELINITVFWRIRIKSNNLY